MYCMTEQPMNSRRALEWTLGDRMGKAMRYADTSRTEMAEYLGVGQSTISSWTSDRIVPSLQTQRLWALRCGVGLDWLPHSLRHWYGTTLVGDGTDLRTAQKLLRHASLATTEIYVEVADIRKAEAIDRLDPFAA
jgi:site-specific recombinase XerD